MKQKIFWICFETKKQFWTKFIFLCLFGFLGEIFGFLRLLYFKYGQLFFSKAPYVFMHVSRGLSARRARRTMSRGPKGLQLEVGPWRGDRLLLHNIAQRAVHWGLPKCRWGFEKVAIQLWPSKVLLKVNIRCCHVEEIGPASAPWPHVAGYQVSTWLLVKTVHKRCSYW